MKKMLLLLVSIVMIFTLASCGDPEIVGYHIDENGKLIATYDDDTTVDLGTLTDTIANGVNTITVNNDGYYVINGVVSKIEAKLPESYSIDTDGNLIVTYTDTTTENLGKFGNDAINTIDTIAISDDGFYVLNGIKTSIVAVDVFDVKFVTGYDTNNKPIVQYRQTELRLTKLSDLKAGDVITLKWMYQTQTFAFIDATGNIVHQTIPTFN